MVVAIGWELLELYKQGKYARLEFIHGDVPVSAAADNGQVYTCRWEPAVGFDSGGYFRGKLANMHVLKQDLVKSCCRHLHVVTNTNRGGNGILASQGLAGIQMGTNISN